jgi:hypothetical protein
VDSSQHEGICYRAANWRPVGTSIGRGRQDRAHQAQESRKDIYIYELDQDFRRHLGLQDYQRIPPLALGEGLDTATWAQNELGGARLGDARLTRRLVSIAQTKGENPGSAFLDVVAGDGSDRSKMFRIV